MKKEEILEKSRLENKEMDEREQQIRLKAIKISRSIGIALSFLILLVDEIFYGSNIIGFICLVITYGMTAFEQWFVTLTLKKKIANFNLIFDTIFFIISFTFLILNLIAG